MFLNINDSAQLASKLTLKRIKNAVQIYRSFHAARNTKIAHIKGLPVSLSIEPTTACNLRCPECPSGLRAFTRPTGKMPFHSFQKLIDELHETLLYLIFYFQGEPYLHPELLDMVRYAADKNLYTATSTNAHFLSEETALETVKSGLNRVIISIDGAGQETYSQYRREGEFSKVLQGTKNLVEAKKALKSKTPRIIWQFLVVRPNEHEIPEMKQLAKRYNVDHLAFKTAQIYDYKNGHPLIPTIEKYSRYEKANDGTYLLKNRMTDECWKMWHSCVVTWDGKVVPCCFDKDANHALGDAFSDSFKRTWVSDSYQRFRQTLLNSRAQIDICRNCSEGSRVWA